MADGYARVTGRPSLAQLSTLGQPTPWARFTMLTVTDLRSCNLHQRRYPDRRPRFPPRQRSGRADQAIHEMELRGPSRRPYSEILNRAFKVASTPPTGPVYLSLPSNLLGESISVQNPDVERVPRRHAWRVIQTLKDAAKLLARAKRPLIVAGSGVAKAGAIEDLVKLAELAAAPVVMEPRYSFLSFPTTHPYSFQIAERQPTFNLPVWGEPDLIFAIGCRLIRVPLHSRLR